MKISGIIAVLVAGCASLAAAEVAPVDVARSKLTVSVEKAGLFSALGHNHTIAAPVGSGSVDVKKRSVELTFRARDMKVTDEGVKETERADIERTMKSEKVLDAERFPEIRFRSTAVTPESSRYRVRGELTLHGVTKPVEMTVESDPGAYRGSVVLKQTDYGIVPVRVAGGAVKVKDEISIQFEIFLSRP